MFQKILIALLVSSPVLAERVDPGSQVPTFTNPSNQMNYGYYGQGSEQASWKQCLWELCGNNLDRLTIESYAHLYGPGQTLLHRNWALFNEMNQLFRKNLESDLEDNEHLVRAWDANTIVDDPRALQFAGNMKAFALFSENVEFNAEKKLDLRKMESALKKSGALESEVKAVLDIAKRSNEQEWKRYSFLEDDYDFAIQTYPPKRIKAQILEAAKELQERTLKAYDSLPLGKAKIEDEKRELNAKIKRIENGEWTRRDVESISQELSVARMLSIALSGTAIIKPFEAKKGIPKETIDKVREKNKIYKEALTDNPPPTNAAILRFKTELDKCHSVIAQAETILPSSTQIQEFAKNEKKRRSEFADGLGSRFSKESKKNLKSSLEKVLIKQSQSFEDWRKSLVDDVKSKLKDQDSFVVSLDEKSALQFALAFHATAEAEKENPTEELVAETIGKICDKKKVDPISDFAYRSGERAHFGPITSRQGPEGIFTSQHEYGHIAYAQFRQEKMSVESRKKFEGMRNCLKAPYGDNDKYLEEDWADLVASSTGSFDSKSNLLCLFLNNHDETSFSLVNSNLNDDHSSGLYRILHFRLYNGGIPPICTKALKAKGEEFKLKKCI